MKTKMLMLTALFAALTAIGAFIKIPMGFTHITLQFFFTVLAGILLGSKWGFASQAVYVLLGLVGIPIFTQGGGFSYILQPTFGFLLALPFVAWTAGTLTRNDVSMKQSIPACLAGIAVIYLIGLPYMYMILNVYLDSNYSVWQVVFSGMILFLPGDILKSVFAAILAKRIRPAVRRGIGD